MLRDGINITPPCIPSSLNALQVAELVRRLEACRQHWDGKAAVYRREAEAPLPEWHGPLRRCERRGDLRCKDLAEAMGVDLADILDWLAGEAAKEAAEDRHEWRPEDVLRNEA